MTEKLKTFKEIDKETSEQIAKGENNELKTGFLEDTKKRLYQIAKFLTTKHTFKTIAGKRSDEIYIYQDGIYIPEGKKTIRKEVERILEEFCTVHYKNEIIEKVKSSTFVEREDFEEKDKNMICVRNGILNLKTRKLSKHTPEQVFLNKIPVIYDPEGRCPEIEKFFQTTFYPDDIPVIVEWCGYALLRNYPIKNAVILYGARDSGKTTFLNLLRTFIGEKNASNVSLQQISKSVFASASLKGKHLNIFDDLSFQDIGQSGGFKMMTGRSRIYAEHKFGDPFSFYNFAKLTFSANKIPQVKDVDDDAYYSRWVLIRCDNVFDENNPETDRHLLERLTTDKELSGLLNSALDGLERLLKNGKFSYEKTPEEVKKIMQRSGSSLACFVQDETEQKDGNVITKREFFEAYSRYTAERGLSRDTDVKVGWRLSKLVPYVGEGKKGRHRAWFNIALKDNRTLDKEGKRKSAKLGKLL